MKQLFFCLALLFSLSACSYEYYNKKRDLNAWRERNYLALKKSYTNQNPNREKAAKVEARVKGRLAYKAKQARMRLNKYNQKMSSARRKHIQERTEQIKKSQ